jgi:hypothetical protein
MSRALAMRKRALDHEAELGFGVADLEPSEMFLVPSLRTGKIDLDEALAASWGLECAGALAWTLDLEPRILPMEELIERAPLAAWVPTYAAGSRAFADGATHRPIGEMVAARHESMRTWARLESSPPGDERKSALEPPRALRWLTEPSLVWLTETQVAAPPEDEPRRSSSWLAVARFARSTSVGGRLPPFASKSRRAWLSDDVFAPPS